MFGIIKAGIDNREGTRLQPRAVSALVRFDDDSDLQIDNNHLENRMRPIALGWVNWLLARIVR